MEHRGPTTPLLGREPQGLHRFTPARLLQGDEPDEEVGVRLAGPQLRHPPELACRLVQHPGLVEGDAQVAVLLDAGVGDVPVHRRRGAARTMHESGGDQAVEGLADLEFPEPGVLDHLVHVARAVEQRQHALLRFGERGLADREPVLVDGEDQVERGDLLLDQAPLVHPARAFEQQRLRVDVDQEVLALRPHLALEVEGPLGPGEEIVDRFFDLDPHVALQVLLADHSHPDQDFAQLLVALLRLPVDGGVELVRPDLLVLHQNVAEPVAPVDDRGVADAPLVEVDVAEVGTIRDRETPGLLPQRQQLQHVGERSLLERAFDRHASGIPRSGGRRRPANPTPSSRGSSPRPCSRPRSRWCAARRSAAPRAAVPPARRAPARR